MVFYWLPNTSVKRTIHLIKFPLAFIATRCSEFVYFSYLLELAKVLRVYKKRRQILALKLSSHISCSYPLYNIKISYSQAAILSYLLLTVNLDLQMVFPQLLWSWKSLNINLS